MRSLRDFLNRGARRLRDALTFQTTGNTQDTTSGRVTQGTPVEKVTVRGNITPVDGLENWQGQQVKPQTTHVVEMRYLDGLTSDMEFVSGGRTFRLIEPPRNPDGRKRYMTFQVREEVPEGV